MPSGDEWKNWLIMTGRGWGKTRTGAETVKTWIKNFRYVNLIGATADDARDIMIEGESGILAVCSNDKRPTYKKQDRKLIWPNGATSLIFTADEPERLRGKQHEKLWADELASWRYADQAWKQANLGLRLGDKPQAVITTTPRPIKVLNEILRDPYTHVTRGATYENRDNMALDFFTKIISTYEGTRLGRQEIAGEMLDSLEGLVYDAFDGDTCVIPRFAIPSDWPRYVGHDFGRINDAVVWYAQEPATGFYYLYRTYHGGQGITERVEDWKELSRDEPIRRRAGGSHQEEQIRQGYSIAGWHITQPTERHVESQVLLVNELHKKNLVYVFSDQSEYLEEKTSYAWAIDKDENYTGKIHNESQFHYMAAERYILSEFKPRPPVSKIEKEVIPILRW
ncbi:MAG: terminase family protein [Bacteroidetes bacterium]|nr:terminase family protein [Bacteroidota bacterium]